MQGKNTTTKGLRLRVAGFFVSHITSPSFAFMCVCECEMCCGTNGSVVVAVFSARGLSGTSCSAVSRAVRHSAGQGASRTARWVGPGVAAAARNSSTVVVVVVAGPASVLVRHSTAAPPQCARYQRTESTSEPSVCMCT